MGCDSQWNEWAKVLVDNKEKLIAARTEFEQIWSNSKCKWFFGGLRQDILWSKMRKKYEIPEYTGFYISTS